LLCSLSDRRPEGLHWLGVSFGGTQDLYNFWSKNHFKPVYLRLTPNDLTGEHTVIMIKPQNGVRLSTIPNQEWLTTFHQDFCRRFVSLLAYEFRHFSSSLALSFIFDPNTACSHALTVDELSAIFTEFDLKRLESYARNLVDYHLVLDLVPHLARLFFLGRLDLKASYSQAAILIGLGLQHKSVTDLEKELELPSSQILAMFNKIMRKMSTWLRSLQENEIRDEMSKATVVQDNSKNLKPLAVSLGQEMKANTKEVNKKMKERTAALLQETNLQKYAIEGSEEEWSKKLAGVSGGKAKSISVPMTAEKAEKKKGKFEGENQGKKGSKKAAQKRKAGVP
jgi:N-acetyltransferase 10